MKGFTAPTRPGRVLDNAEAMALGQRLLNLVEDKSYGVFIEHTSRAVTSVVHGHTPVRTIGDEFTIGFRTTFGSGFPVSITTNELSVDALERIAKRAVALAPPAPPPQDAEVPDTDAKELFTFNKREFIPVSLWHDATAEAVESPPGVDDMADTVERARLHGAVTAVQSARSMLYLYKAGLTAWSHETDSELTVTARNQEDQSSGWAGIAHRDWSKASLAREAVTQRAIEWAKRAVKPSAVEPGRRTAILGPTAVAQLMCALANAFDGGGVKYGMSPFSLRPGRFVETGRWNLIGERVFDARLRFSSDPTDPDGGFPPFFEQEGMYPPGLPYPAMTWIDGGVLKQLAFDTLFPGHPWSERPYSVRIEAMPGVPTSTIDEMIAACDDGIYVNRFGTLSPTTYQNGGPHTGVTRDGCFFIKNGKIDRPVKNFRILEGPAGVMNRVQMIGVPTRVALGQPETFSTRRIEEIPVKGRWGRWPQLPVIVPPLMVKDFNFVALADNV